VLLSKSLTELRGIAQSFGVSDIFKKDQLQLVQAIEMKQQSLAPVPKIEIPKTNAPDPESVEEIEQQLKPYIDRGLRVRFSDTQWFMSCGSKNDEGTLSMPMRQILKCADEVIL